MEVCSKGAEHDAKRDPHGVQWLVRRFEMEQKPATMWHMIEREFQITKTYCLELHPLYGRHDRPLWQNLIFADQSEGKFFTAATQQIPITDMSYMEAGLLSKQTLG